MNAPSTPPTTAAAHHYNPGWADDDTAVANFIARQDEFAFLRGELARVPREGSAQHHLLVGVRGAGKTTLLKRLAVAIRRDADLRDHLIALSFPEELYQVKNLSDFWWASCEALADELYGLAEDPARPDAAKLAEAAGKLEDAMAQARAGAAQATAKAGAKADADAAALSGVGLQCLLQACAALGLRPVLLVDNLDMVLARIDKTGRKLKDPHSPAYWALREALSTTTSPIVIGGSTHLSEPFTGYDKAFYDFFMPKRLGKLSLQEANAVLEHLADARGEPEVKQRLKAQPSRVEALYELTGGNPRALGLIFDLLRQGPNSRAVEDFERLMDLTTPYYKARLEDLSEQAQVVMHALATGRSDAGSALRFGPTAAETASQSGLPTGTVSAQLDALEKEGLVEKSAEHGRTQYRIAEQLFRLWLQMRTGRRVRQSVIGLTRFLEAMFSLDELQDGLREDRPEGRSASDLDGARYAFAVADTSQAEPMRRGIEAIGAERVRRHVRASGDDLQDHLAAEDLPADIYASLSLATQLEQCRSTGLAPAEQEALLGSPTLTLEQKQASVQALCEPATAPAEVERLRPILEQERQSLLRYGLREADLPLLYRKRAQGLLPLPELKPEDADAACVADGNLDIYRAMVWRLLGTRHRVKVTDGAVALTWLNWGRRHAGNASPVEWANVAGTMRLSKQLDAAQQALDESFRMGETARGWHDRGALLHAKGCDLSEVEAAYRHAIDLDPADVLALNNLGLVLAGPLKRFGEAEAAYRRAVEIDPKYTRPWENLSQLLAGLLKRYGDAEASYRRAMALEPANAKLWRGLGLLLAGPFKRYEEAEAAYRKAIELDPVSAKPWNSLGNLLARLHGRHDEALAAYRKAIELEPTFAWPWNNLGLLLAGPLEQYEDAERAYRKAIDLDPMYAQPLNNLGNLLAGPLKRLDEAEEVYRKAIERDPAYALPWTNLGIMLAGSVKRYNDAEEAYRKAIELDPMDARTWNNMGILLAGPLKRHDDAEETYRKAIELDPGNARPWNSMGILLAGSLKRHSDAEKAYRKAIELDPGNAWPWNNLGTLLARLPKRQAEAELKYRKALELDPANAKAWSNLGDLLNMQGRLADACAAYAAGRKLDAGSVLYCQERYAQAQTRLQTQTARDALQANDLSSAREALRQLLAESVDLSAALASAHFVEEFLGPLLSQTEQAQAVLALLTELGYTQAARPLLLALEAAVDSRQDMLAVLEPEVKKAALRMFERLTGKKAAVPRKPATRRSKAAK